MRPFDLGVYYCNDIGHCSVSLTLGFWGWDLYKWRRESDIEKMTELLQSHPSPEARLMAHIKAFELQGFGIFIDGDGVTFFLWRGWTWYWLRRYRIRANL